MLPRNKVSRLWKDLLTPDNKDNEWLFNQQSYVSQRVNSDVQFSYVEQGKPEPSDLTSQEASEVSLQELKEMVPNQKVNMYAILSVATKEPNKVETKSSQALSVKEDCISEDNTTMMELHIWELLFSQLKSNKAFYQGSKIPKHQQEYNLQ